MHLIDNGHDRPAGDAGLAPASFDFESQPLRPGTAYEAVAIELGLELTVEAAAAAAREHYPLEPWLVLVVESERAVRAVGSPAGLADALDLSAVELPEPRVHRSSRSRLLTYATAIRKRTQANSENSSADESRPSSTLSLPVPYNATVAWAVAASEQELALNEWATDLLAALPQGRPLWEAASAEAGLTLAEWVAVYAARSSRD